MIKLSVVIVAYKNMECLTKCLESIPQLSWLEVLVVNNSHQNRGFGAGCNLGAKYSNGRYIFFLNPDCIVSGESLRELVKILDGDNSIGIIGPRLTDLSGKPYLSCSLQPTQKTMPIVYSILNKIFYRSELVMKHWLNQKPPNDNIEVGIVSGAAMVMEKKLFNRIGGFDENFFLYWEEVDLAKRVIQEGKRVVFAASSTIVHVGELSTLQKRPQIQKWFNASRYYFMKKYFSKFYALLVEAWFTALEEWRLILVVLSLVVVGLEFYMSGRWFGPAQVWLWHRWGVLLGLRLTQMYWMGVGGAVAGAIGFYNEVEIVHKWRAAGMSLLVGLMLIMTSPFGAVITVLAGLMWLVYDLQPLMVQRRKRVISLLVASSVLLTVWGSWKTLTYGGFTAPVEDWQMMSQLIMSKNLKFSSIRCLGCTQEDELWPLAAWMSEYNLEIGDTGNEIFISLPPFSEYQSGIPNTMTYRVGEMKLSVPLRRL